MFPVTITWRDPQYDWNNFWLLYERKEGYLLKGRDKGDIQHDGDIFFAYKEEIKTFQVHSIIK